MMIMNIKRSRVFSTVSSSLLKSLLVAGIVFTGTFGTSLSDARADDNKLQIDIAPSFDWTAKSIRKLAYNTAKVHSARCEPPCTINVRVMIKDSAQRVSEKRLGWLRKNLVEEMARRTQSEIVVQDSIIFV